MHTYNVSCYILARFKMVFNILLFIKSLAVSQWKLQFILGSHLINTRSPRYFYRNVPNAFVLSENVFHLMFFTAFMFNKILMELKKVVHWSMVVKRIVMVLHWKKPHWNAILHSPLIAMDTVFNKITCSLLLN